MGTIELIPSIAASKFSPLSVSGLDFWLDGTDPSVLFTDAGTTPVAVNGDKIRQANDKSGQGNHVSNATLANRPAYTTGASNGHSAARFDITDVLNLATFTGGAISAPYTIFLVGSTTRNDAGFAVSMGNGAGAEPYIYKTNAAPGLWQMNGGSGPIGAVAADTNKHVFVGIVNGASSKFYVDGGTPATGNAGSLAMNGITVGAYDAVSTLQWQGDVVHLLVYSGAVAVSDINSLGQAFATQSGLTWTAAT